MTHPEVQTFIDSLSPDVRKVVVAVQQVVLTTAPEGEESVLWGTLSYHRPLIGGRVKGAVCQISAKAGEVRLEFIHGVRLADPRKILRGNRISKRYVPIPTVVAARQPEIVALVRRAAAVEFADPD